MIKILITGDIHNDFGVLNEIINKKKPELVICCGDFGYWPKVKWGKPLSMIKRQDATILWCDGNHEDHWSLKERKSNEIEKGIIYMPRGSIYTLPDGRNIMFMGGAFSIDKEWRQIGVDWFPEETITQKDLMGLPDIKVDILISHTCSTELLPEMLVLNPWKINDPSNDALSEVWKQYKPDLWYFGHWHQYKEGMLENTKWYCLGAPLFQTTWWKWLNE